VNPGALDRLHAAYLMAGEGRHQDALDEYVWFHQHALAEDPSLIGVRLSYGLFYWMALAQVYPPASAALAAQRDRHAAALLDGSGNRQAFDDLAAIDARLGDAARTYAVFRDLLARDPDLAQACSGRAMDAIIDAGDFALAGRFLPDPEASVRRAGAGLNRDVANRRVRAFTAAPWIKSDILNYAKDVKRIATVLDGCGRQEEARRITKLAADLIPATTIRRAVRAALLPGARPWYERSALSLRTIGTKEKLRHRRQLAKAARGG
jgi:tetratricopeptide (TPR) repeat protein